MMVQLVVLLSLYVNTTQQTGICEHKSSSRYRRKSTQYITPHHPATAVNPPSTLHLTTPLPP